MSTAIAPLSPLLTDEELTRAQNDWIAARDSRTEREEIWKSNYETYRGIKAETQAAAREMGWSNIKVPLCFTIVETARPRLAVQPPTITCNAKSPQAVPYALAKQMRLQHDLYEGCSEAELFDISGQMLIYGSAPAKVPYIRRDRRPELRSVPLFDFFLSPDARRAEEAEVIWHRSWYTRRQLDAMAAQQADGEQLWHNLDAVWAQGPTRESADPHFSDLRTASGQGGASKVGANWQVPVLEGWYADGTYIALGGYAGNIPIRVGRSPFFRADEDGERRYIRPFVMFSNTPDVNSPWGISLVEILEDIEAVVTTMLNQTVDQGTHNLNAGVVYDDRIPAEDVQAFMRAPGGQMPIRGFADVRQAVMRMPPGQISQDFPQLFDILERITQQVSGINDVTQGQVVGNDQTATEVAISNQEVNKRFAMLIRYMESGMGKVARIMDGHDRQFRTRLDVPVDRGFTPPEGAQGFSPPGGSSGAIDPLSLMSGQGPQAGAGAFDQGFASIGPEVNQAGAEYDFEVDAGSTALPGQLDQARKMNMLIGDLSNPMFMGLVSPAELAKQLIEAHGFSPEKILVAPGTAMPGAMPGAPDPNAPPGMEPVGPPMPVEGEAPPMDAGAPMGPPMPGPAPAPPAPAAPQVVVVPAPERPYRVLKRVIRDPETGQITAIEEINEPDPLSSNAPMGSSLIDNLMNGAR